VKTEETLTQRRSGPSGAAFCGAAVASEKEERRTGWAKENKRNQRGSLAEKRSRKKRTRRRHMHTSTCSSVGLGATAGFAVTAGLDATTGGFAAETGGFAAETAGLAGLGPGTEGKIGTGMIVMSQPVKKKRSSSSSKRFVVCPA
jgi:hypothetical protein